MGCIPDLRQNRRHTEPHRHRGPDWTPITPKTGSLFHACSQTIHLDLDAPDSGEAPGEACEFAAAVNAVLPEPASTLTVRSAARQLRLHTGRIAASTRNQRVATRRAPDRSASQRLKTS